VLTLELIGAVADREHGQHGAILSFQRVRVFPRQPDQGGGLLVRLASTLLPPLEGPWIHTNLEGEHAARHLERLARLADDLRVDWRDSDRLHFSCLQREPPFAVIPYADQLSVGWIMHADGTALQPLSADERRMRLITRCGRDTQIAYAVPRGNIIGVFLVDADRGQPRKIAEPPFALGAFPSCSPDGQQMIYTAGRGLMKISTAGGTPSVFAQLAHEGRISPDGKRVAAHKVEQSGEKLGLFSMEDGSLVRILPGDANGGFQWQPDGSALIVRAAADGVDNFYRVPIDGSPRTQLSHFTATDSIFSIAIHPDGRLAFSRGTVENDAVMLTITPH
jgi:Tol biopolymer transport system component